MCTYMYVCIYITESIKFQYEMWDGPICDRVDLDLLCPLKIEEGAFVYVCMCICVYVTSMYVCVCVRVRDVRVCVLVYVCVHIRVPICDRMWWLRLVGSLISQISFAKEPYKRDDILLKRPIILRSLLSVATP